VELAGAAVEDGEPNEEIFLLLREALTLLVSNDDQRLLRTFEIRLLRIAGYLLELYRCLVCRSALEWINELAISPARGGMICPKCRNRVQDTLAISLESLEYLRSVLIGEFPKSVMIPLPPPHDDQLQEVLKICIAYFLGKSLRSISFLKRLEWGI